MRMIFGFCDHVTFHRIFPSRPRPGKAQKRLQSLAAGQEGVPLLSAVACDEDAMSREDIVAEDRLKC